jgi:hypothetical protein
MSVFNKWYAGLPPRWQQMVFWSPLYGLTCGVAFGLLSRELSGMVWGFFVGLIGLSLLHYFADRRYRRDRPQRSAEVLEDPTFQMVEREHLKRMSILLPVMAGVGFLVSLVAFGTGLHGLLVGLSAWAVILYLSWRFGGPGDPKWKNRA